MSSEREGTVPASSEPKADCPLCKGKGVLTKRTDGGGATDGEFSYDVWCECHYRPVPAPSEGIRVTALTTPARRLPDAIPAPSDEAVEVAILTAAYPDHDDGHTDTYYAGILTAAYAIDWPRREAEVRAEERAATLREVEPLRVALSDLIGNADCRCDHRLVVEPCSKCRASQALAHFNPEAE